MEKNVLFIFFKKTFCLSFLKMYRFTDKFLAELISFYNILVSSLRKVIQFGDFINSKNLNYINVVNIY